MPGDPQIQKLLDKLDLINQTIEINQSYCEGTNTLLGRLIYPNNASIGEIVVKKQTQLEKYLQAYNSCDGSLTVTEIAQKCGLDKSNLNKVFTEWALIGIIYEINKPGGKYYKNLRKIEYKKEETVRKPRIKPMEEGKQDSVRVENQSLDSISKPDSNEK